MKRSTVALLLAIIAGIVAVALAQASPSGFVGQSGATLTLNGNRWRFVAFDDYQLPSLPMSFTCGGPLDQTTLDGVLQDAKQSGATVIRTWFFQSYYDLDVSGHATTPSWAAFDRVLQSAAMYGLKVIPVLTNEYTNCDPYPETKNLAFFTGGYTQPEGPYPLSYKMFATQVAQHYADNRTIAFWQLGNELYVNSPDCTTSVERTAEKALRSFADTMSGAIKAVDPNHLVSLGTEGTGQCGVDGSDYARVQAGGIDICDYHDYGEVTRPLPSDDFNRLAQRIAQCRAMHKPLVVTEAGISANVNDQGEGTGPISAATLQLRAGFFAAKLSAAFAAGVAGYGIWEIQQDPSNSPYNLSNGEYEVGPGDPTLTATATAAAHLGRRPPHVRFTFEDDRTDGWYVSGGSAGVSNTSAEAWDGDRSLQLSLNRGANFAAVATRVTRGAGSGTTLTFRVYRPLYAPATLEARPQVVNRNSLVRGPTVALLSGWNTITWTLSGHLHRPLTRIGLAIVDPQGWGGSLELDGVAWGA